MKYNIVKRDDSEASSIDKGIKNKFCWSWLEEKDANGMFLSEWVRKIDLAGQAICTICDGHKMIYGSQGKSAIFRHARRQDHKDRISANLNNSSLPASHTLPEIDDGSHPCTLPYGAAPNIHSEVNCSSRIEPVLPRIPIFQDRLAHNEAFIVSFIAENSLPFTMAPKLIEFAKFLARDSKVLAKIKMSRETAAYNLTEGLGPIIKSKVIASMRDSYFSMNVDECFSNNNQKVFSIIVSYFDKELGEVVVQHYRSETFKKVNANNLATFFLNSIKEDSIPLENVISNLSDSTNYMRGKKAGYETLLRKEIPHLLDVDGDVCHHAHNAAGKFVLPFGKVIEKLCTDLHTEAKFSTDIRGYLVELCEMLVIPFHMPPNYTEHRWLSVLTSADVNQELLPVLIALYYAWVDPELKEIHAKDVEELISSSSEHIQRRIRVIQHQCVAKSLTEAGRDRKKRIVEKVIYKRLVTELHLSLYTHILPLIKSFVLIFEQKVPMIHRYFEELKNTIVTFLSCFIKVEEAKKLRSRDLKTFDVMNTEYHKSFSD